MLRNLQACAIALFLLIAFSASDAEAAESCSVEAPYEGVSVVGIRFPSESSADAVREALEKICEIRLLRDEIPSSSDEFVEYMLTRAQLKQAQKMLPRSTFRVLIGDLNAAIIHESATEIAPPAPKAPKCTLTESSACLTGSLPMITPSDAIIAGKIDVSFYKKYHSYEDLVERYKLLAATYSPYVTLETIGESVEGRPLHMFRVGNTSEAKPIRVLFNAMQHAREWITTMTVLYTVERLAAEASRSESWDSKVQLLVVPISNPDGFVYTHVADRMWRKNRSPETRCRRSPGRTGVDLNRNWAKDFSGGESTSSDPCSDVFTGPKPFSEPETQALSNLVTSTPGLVAHIDVHAFSQLVLGRWSYSDDKPPRVKEVDELGELLNEQLSSGGKRYDYARGKTDHIYLASGVMPDWVFTQGVLSYTFELRPKTTWEGGFILPAKQIIPTSKEFFKAAATVLDYVVS